MDPTDRLALKNADINLRKATNLEAIVIDLRYNLDLLSDEARQSPDRDIFFTLEVWLIIFQLTVDENTEHWKEERETVVDYLWSKYS